MLELLLADHRTIRTRPAFDGEHYDAALFNVKYARHARFKGLVRAMVAFRRMRLRAAQAVYAPGGAGFAAAAAHFNAAVAATAMMPAVPLCLSPRSVAHPLSHAFPLPLSAVVSISTHPHLH